MVDTVYKGDIVQTTLVTEDNGWAKVPSTYAGGRVLPSNDGTMNQTRNTRQSEARTKSSEVSDIRLGNRNNTGSFTCEVDPVNYNMLFESLLYSQMTNKGFTTVLSGVSLTASSKYHLTIPLTAGELSTIDPKVGDIIYIKDISSQTFGHLEGQVHVTQVTGSGITVFSPDQVEDSIAAATTNITLEAVNMLKPARTAKSFNLEETLYAEDGTNKSHFMSVGCIVSSLALSMASDANTTAAFSFVSSRQYAGEQYPEFDTNLTAGNEAHTTPVEPTAIEPLAMQDGSFVTGTKNTLCAMVSGELNVENGTEITFTSCSFDGAAAVSGKTVVTLTQEVMFESEADYVSWDREEAKSVFIRLKEADTGRTISILLPKVKATAYNKAVGTGVVTATVSAQAVINPEHGTGIVIGVKDVE